MLPDEILQALQDAGTTVRVHDGQLLIGPTGRLTNDLRAVIRQSKAELLDLLQRRMPVVSIDDLILTAMRVCELYGDDERSRDDMRIDCLATPPHLRSDLLRHLTSITAATLVNPFIAVERVNSDLGIPGED